MWQASVFGVGFAAGPNFVQQERVRRFRGAVQIVTKAAFFFARRTRQRAEFRFQQRFLAFASTQDDDERDGIFREFLVLARP